MEIYVARIEGSYRGFDRAVGPLKLNPKRNHNVKKNLNRLITMYLDFVSAEVKFWEDCIIEDILNAAKVFYDALKRCEYDCEIIAHDTKPIDKICDVELSLLGIDVSADGESALIKLPNSFPSNILNEFGLFNSLSDFERSKCFIPLLQQQIPIELCYVYRLNYKEAGC